MKQKTKSKSKFKSFLGSWFLGLFSNNKAIEGSKRHPWWVGLILAFIAIWLPIFPIISTYSNMSGSDFIGNYKYGFNYLPELTIALQDDTSEFNKIGEKVDFKVDESNKLLMYVDGVQTTRNEKTPLAQYVAQRSQGSEIKFEIYYISGNDNDVVTFINELTAREFKVGTVDKYVPSEEGALPYTPSILVLYESGLFASIYKDDTTTAAGTTVASDWKHTKKNQFLLQECILQVEGATVGEAAYTEGVVKNWNKVFDDTYKSQKSFNVMFFMGLYLIIYIVLVFLMGLLVFFLTRGKHNMFNYLKFMDCQKMTWWIAFAPALLAMLLSFLMPGMASMLFIILMGLRVMWMSMKQLKPQY